MSVSRPSRKPLPRLVARNGRPGPEAGGLGPRALGQGRAVAVFAVAALVIAGSLAFVAVLSSGSPSPGLAQIGAQFARPSADVATGAWGTVPLWDKLDEATPD